MASSVTKWAAVLLIVAVLTPGEALQMPALATQQGRVVSLRGNGRAIALRNAVKMSVTRREAIAAAFTAAITLVPTAFPSAVGLMILPIYIGVMMFAI